jgi:hypothetical protein
MRWNVHIERIVLEGVPMHDNRTLRAAIEEHVAEGIRAGGLPSDVHVSRVVPYLRARDIRMERNSGTESFGRQIGGAVCEGIGVRK